MNRAGNSVCLTERFPLYQQLLLRDRRAARMARLNRMACCLAAFLLGAIITVH
ncbi:hypothetical protein ACJ5NV_09405 [Loktanella agnita]